MTALAINSVQVLYGFGNYVDQLTPQDQLEVRRWNFALEVPILIGTAASKISVSLLLLRLLGASASPTRACILQSINYFIAAYTAVDIISNMVACIPVAKIWNFDLEGACRSEATILGVTYFQGGW